MLAFSIVLAVKVNKVVGAGFSQSYNSFVRYLLVCDDVGTG